MPSSNLWDAHSADGTHFGEDASAGREWMPGHVVLSEISGFGRVYECDACQYIPVAGLPEARMEVCSDDLRLIF
jgi:hypothetical protein